MGDYHAMQTPKRGLKQIDDPIYDGPRPDVMSLFPPVATWTAWMWRLFMAPFNDVSAYFTFKMLFAMVFVFLGSLVLAVTFIGAQAAAVTAGTDAFLTAVLLAFVSASTYYVTTMWTYFDDLPTIIYPAHSFGMVGTMRFGFFLACIYGVFQFAGYSAAGGILKALGVTGTLQNVAANNADTYWLYWFGGSVICFSFVYNRLFVQAGESSLETASRSAKATSYAIFAMTVAWYVYGLNSFNSGIFAAQSIIAGGAAPAAYGGDPVVAWAFFIFVDLLAVPATSWLLVVVFAVFYYFMERDPARTRISNAGPFQQEYGMSAEVRSSESSYYSTNDSSSRLKQRKAPVVSY